MFDKKEPLALPSPNSTAPVSIVPERIGPQQPAFTYAEPETEEQAIPLSHYLWILKRRRWEILAFVLTFWVVGLSWLTHHRQFQFIRRYDGRLLTLNLLFLMTVCFIPWPTAVLGHYGEYFTVWVLYAASMTAMGFTAAAVWVYASGRPSLVDHVTPELRRYYAERAVVMPTVFLLSIPLAAVWLTAGQYSWILIFVILRILNYRHRDRIAADLRPLV